MIAQLNKYGMCGLVHVQSHTTHCQAWKIYLELLQDVIFRVHQVGNYEVLLFNKIP